MRFRILGLAIVATLCVGEGRAAEAGDNVVFQTLVDQGVPWCDGRLVRLPPPTLADGLDAAAQRTVVEDAAGRHGWHSFVRDSAVSPFTLKLAYLKDEAGRRIGHSIDLWFVAHGELDAIASEQLAREVHQVADDDAEFASGARELEDVELAKLGLQRMSRDRESYLFARTPVLNRVYVSGVVRGLYSKSESSLVAAWILDDRFATAEELSSRWRPIEVDPSGRKRLGAEQDYRGYGGYLKITRLLEPPGSLFVEVHVAFHEPEAWFGGGNQLRSKMPLAIQESVRKFRREIKGGPARE